MPYSHLIAATVMILGVCQGHSSIASFFYTDWEECLRYDLYCGTLNLNSINQSINLADGRQTIPERRVVMSRDAFQILGAPSISQEWLKLVLSTLYKGRLY